MFLSAFADDETVAQGARRWVRWPTWSSRWISRKIVPTVDAALSSVRARRAQVPFTPSVGATPAPAMAADPLADPIPVAVGVLMHRYSLPRGEALSRLHRLADSDGRSVHAQAAALLDAVEMLSRPASG
jgi:hypothetical protein